MLLFATLFAPLSRRKDLWVRAKDPGRQAIFCLIKIKKGYAREAKSFSLSCQRWWWWRRRRSTKTPSDYRRRRLRKFDNEDKCLSFAGAWPVAKKFLMQIFTLIMPIKSMISALHQSNKHLSDCQKVFPTKPMNVPTQWIKLIGPKDTRSRDSDAMNPAKHDYIPVNMHDITIRRGLWQSVCRTRQDMQALSRK